MEASKTLEFSAAGFDAALRKSQEYSKAGKIPRDITENLAESAAFYDKACMQVRELEGKHQEALELLAQFAEYSRKDNLLNGSELHNLADELLESDMPYSMKADLIDKTLKLLLGIEQQDEVDFVWYDKFFASSDTSIDANEKSENDFSLRISKPFAWEAVEIAGKAEVELYVDRVKGAASFMINVYGDDCRDLWDQSVPAYAAASVGGFRHWFELSIQGQLENVEPHSYDEILEGAKIGLSEVAVYSPEIIEQISAQLEIVDQAFASEEFQRILEDLQKQEDTLSMNP